MAQVLVTGLLAFLLLQLAASQDACQSALATLSANAADCTATVDAICTGQCRQYYDDIIANCDASNAATYKQALDQACTQGTTDTDDQCTDALNELGDNSETCPAETEDPAVACSAQCRSYYENAIRYCSPENLDEFNSICANAGYGDSGNSNSSGRASVFKGLGIFSLLLSMIAAVVF